MPTYTIARGCNHRHDKEKIEYVDLYEGDYCKEGFNSFFDHFGQRLCEIAFPSIAIDPAGELFNIVTLLNPTDMEFDLHLISALMSFNSLNSESYLREHSEMMRNWEKMSSERKRTREDADFKPQKKQKTESQ